MASFRNGEVEIAYLDEGEGEPIVLIHGFASNKEVNWVLPGWVATLMRAGQRVIALDNRGHGVSSKLYDPSAYHGATMAEDARALLDYLNIERADVMGYSMGARITALLAVNHHRACARRYSAGLASRSWKVWPAGEHRRSAGAPRLATQGCDRSRVSNLRRTDKIRFARARRASADRAELGRTEVAPSACRC
jgi:pimeloyl-ACP methyl ester carboxylesterase